MKLIPASLLALAKINQGPSLRRFKERDYRSADESTERLAAAKAKRERRASRNLKERSP